MIFTIKSIDPSQYYSVFPKISFESSNSTHVYAY